VVGLLKQTLVRVLLADLVVLSALGVVVALRLLLLLLLTERRVATALFEVSTAPTFAASVVSGLARRSAFAVLGTGLLATAPTATVVLKVLLEVASTENASAPLELSIASEVSSAVRVAYRRDDV
jgi:hypothetical protein